MQHSRLEEASCNRLQAEGEVLSVRLVYSLTGLPCRAHRQVTACHHAPPTQCCYCSQQNTSQWVSAVWLLQYCVPTYKVTKVRLRSHSVLARSMLVITYSRHMFAACAEPAVILWIAKEYCLFEPETTAWSRLCHKTHSVNNWQGPWRVAQAQLSRSSHLYTLEPHTHYLRMAQAVLGIRAHATCCIHATWNVVLCMLWTVSQHKYQFWLRSLALLWPKAVSSTTALIKFTGVNNSIMELNIKFIRLQLCTQKDMTPAMYNMIPQQV